MDTDQYENDEMACNYTKYRQKNKIVECIYKPSVLKLVGDLTNKSIIDYGCGSGFYSRLFTKTAKKVIGIDYSKQMIELAKKIGNATEIGMKNVEYHVGDCAEDVNLGKHDVVFSSFLLCHANNCELLESFSRSMFNSCKAGATCCGITFNTFSKSSDYPFLRKYGFDIKLAENPQNGDERILQIFDGETDKLMVVIRDHFIAPDVIEATFKKVGFINFKWVKVELGDKYFTEADYLADYLAHPNGIMYFCQKPF